MFAVSSSMRTLRTFLALSVLLAHTGVRGLVGGRMAVQLFYTLSGFLISSVVFEARRHRTYGRSTSIVI